MEFKAFIVTIINYWGVSATNRRFTIIIGTCIIIITVHNIRCTTVNWTAIVSVTFVIILTFIRNINFITSIFRRAISVMTFIGWLATIRYICVNTALIWTTCVFGTLITIIAIYLCVFTRIVFCTFIITNFFSTSIRIITFNRGVGTTVIWYTYNRIASAFVRADIWYIGTSGGFIAAIYGTRIVVIAINLVVSTSIIRITSI
jgi:hypothetical protein